MRLFFLVAMILFAQGAASEQPAPMSCSPSVVTDKGLITIRFGDAERAEFGVVSPEGRFLYVTVSSLNIRVDSKPIMGGEVFAALEGLIIDTTTFIATNWSQPVVNELVFVEEGTYTFRAAQTLSSHDVNVSECTVEFRHE